MSEENKQPPRVMLAFFRWFCDPVCKEDIEGDIVELFQLRASTMNERKARWLFAKDVLCR